ncbi:hypothetical protein PAECIP111892_01052 [Paenibacillus auburnensis]|uniref:KOW domain-containing protein n=1 Tax=Paenibacillus auburnensis TaxID=2905649 RepID=A0ABM9BQL1_9BACL|nr:hypothetical protein PAECIP111892_01052 [Paenibacillus auburnensis]
MKWGELEPGLPVRIISGYHKGNTGKVSAVETFGAAHTKSGLLWTLRSRCRQAGKSLSYRLQYPANIITGWGLYYLM